MMSTSDRHRMMIATVVTVVALPTLWIASRDDAGNVPRVAAAGAPSPAVDVTDAVGDTRDDYDTGPVGDPTGGDPAVPAYLEGPGSPADTTATAPIASPDASDGLRGTAGYERFPPGLPNRSCRVDTAPWGAIVTIRNLDTDRSTSCLNISSAAGAGPDIATLDISVFLDIAELVDAPLPVELSW